ncbi:MAG: hypothetical protein J5854_01740 [Clostridia bacterium]|nr:hypothetical protein [Clostridia bacterium]
MKRRIISVILLVLSAAAIPFLPFAFRAGAGNDPFGDFFAQKREPYVGVVTVWHIVSFKPYVGSLGSWLEARAKEYLSSYNNLYFEIRSYSKEDADAELRRGSAPDILSFAYGSADPCDLYSGDGTEPCAYPYCASGRVILFDPSKTDRMTDEEIAEKAGSVSDLKSGKAVSCITDIRGAGDLIRAQLMDKCPYFEIKPLGSDPELVQYIGIAGSIDEKKLPYAKAFIDHVTGKASQKTLPSIGLIPISDKVGAEYEQDWLEALYTIVKKYSPSPLYRDIEKKRGM